MADEKKTLSERVKSFRYKARRILRMKMINSILAEIFNVNKDVKIQEKSLENLKKEMVSESKRTARAEYKMSKLDENNPDYEELVEKAKENIVNEAKIQETAIKNIEEYIKSREKRTEQLNKEIEQLNKEIEMIEEGETKVSIEEVNDLALSLINKS